MSDYRQQINSALGSSTTCVSCPAPCGVGTTIPGGSLGYYNLDFDAGSDASSTGAIVIYFNPYGFPDGIRVLYDNVYYNTVTNNTEGRIQTSSGVAGAFTILGLKPVACMPTLPNQTTYNSFDGFTNNAWDPATPSTKTINIASADYVGGGSNKYSTLIIPKPSAAPSIVSIQVLGVCSQTNWAAEVSCPAALPSFSASTIANTNTCNTTQNTPVYFAQNYGDTNTAPIIGNFVFTDENGATPLNNTSTSQYYIIGTNAFEVVKGVVVSSNPCT